MKANWRTARLLHQCLGRRFEDREAFQDTRFRLKEEYVDEPCDIYPEMADQPLKYKLAKGLLFVVLAVCLVFGCMALMSLPIALTTHSPYDCYAAGLNRSAFILNNTASEYEQFCYCQLNEDIFFSAAANDSFHVFCSTVFDALPVSTGRLAASGAIMTGCNLLVSLAGPLLATLLSRSTRYGMACAALYVTVALQVCNSIVSPVVLNARWNNIRGINTVNFFLSGSRPNSMASPDFTRFWFANLSVWVVTGLLVECAVPWLGLLAAFLRQRVALSWLQHRQGRLTQRQLNQQILFDELDAPAHVARLMAVLLLVLFYAPGMPLASLLGVVVLLMTAAAFALRAFYLSSRGYVPPVKFYVNALRVLKYMVVFHLLIGAYMYGNVLSPLPLLGL